MILGTQGYVSENTRVSVQPYFRPLPGYNMLIEKRLAGSTAIVAGKMACLLSERFLRAAKGIGTTIIAYPYSYCFDRIREKSLRAGVGIVEPAPTPPRGWIDPGLKFRLWTSLRYMLSQHKRELASTVWELARLFATPEADARDAIRRIAADIVDKHYSESVIAAEEFMETRLGEEAVYGRVSAYTLTRVEEDKFPLATVAAKHQANKTGRVIVYVKKGRAADFLVIALPNSMRSAKASEIARYGAARGLYKLRIYDAGRTLVEGISSVRAGAEEIASVLSEALG